MNDDRLVVVITGANRGIGKAITRQLLLQNDKPLIVYLTARNVDRGQKAFDELRREQLRNASDIKMQNELRFHQLDVSNHESIHAFIAYLTLMHGEFSIDVLINNAGGVVKKLQDMCNADTAYQTVHMNYFTAVSMTTLALPHMREHGRVIFMVTALAHLGIFCGDLPRVLTSDDLSLNGLNIIENGFISSVGKGTYAGYGFPPMPFNVAKAGLIAYARILARSTIDDSRGLLFAAVCPGYVKTDMTGAFAPLTPDQGAETPVYIALTDNKRLRRHNGGLWKRLKPIKW
ncbi:NAD(P)-binding protein [Coemansia reversa NRRL 1564]|uniref:NAD(P)-binding protein n=1 Tax=Coemansia reversa (strain ATCC 12441 / NRRL 1564) TaxID=763665 RepID=A0A2G5B2U5_COERN|nr:NAD(P)-binding protein [Coemansia reversa NRRL 1564]|eukprot:PIA13338.1 NAD(P)-binding protein [Coemansia reversa NRRL 1564]